MAVKESPSKAKVEEPVTKTEGSLPKVQKFSKEELESLTNLQSKTQDATMRLGQLYLSKIRIEEQEESYLTYMKTLEEEEMKLAKELSDKYGKGSINIETGEFTPLEN